MKWKTKTFLEKRACKKKAKMEWRDFYAWYPVLQDGCWYWFEHLQRKFIDTPESEPFMGHYRYKEK